jgi:glyoxylase-like metal-dependent hydrolase (beta-lactamase superfamily II)
MSIQTSPGRTSRTPIGLVIALALTAGCGGDAPAPPAGGDADAEPANSQLALYVLNCGRIQIKDMSMFTPGENEGQEMDGANTCYVVSHSTGGTLVWDAGLPDALADLPDGQEDESFGARMDRTMTAQLAELDLTPGSVDYIALSHLHFDHSGNANAFAGVTWLVQTPEFEAAFGPEPQAFGFDPTSYGELEATAMLLDGEHDVFGDGSVTIIPAPGHTPGHQVLLVDLPETGPVLLSGDLWHMQYNRDNRGVPSFNWDADATLASMDKIEGVLAETGARLIIQHDPTHVDGLPYAPAALR